LYVISTPFTHNRWQESWLTKRTEMHHPQRRKGSDHALLTESEIEIGTGSLLLLKIGSGTGQGTDDEEAAALAPVPVPSLLRGKVILHICYVRRVLFCFF
jgi:hypothetical protein